ncbi:hypothetical protein LX16_5191 [Stackebrandtia albiflava]|uniref:Uncharacterized protein n=1 Tax=Stackebrandtia albiflava TaxID=406432 RepID=A0A562ULH0_9ACTN|nr:hypothetical protein [Stackebrandtia albiflava]TWJ06455.1 hypothetical protein LX16_5191 [Stackebrandtia albiflava]
MDIEVTAADIEWADRYGHARVCGHLLRAVDILALEQVGDRRLDGELRRSARERLAADFTERFRRKEAAARADWETRNGRPATVRDCDG